MPAPTPVITDKQKAEIESAISEALTAMCFNPGAIELGLQFAKLLKPRITFSTAIPTAAVNEQGLQINPGFMASKTLGEVVFMCAHEIMHIVAQHLDDAVQFGLANVDRREDGSRVLTTIPGKQWESRVLNFAQDIWINDWLIRLKVGTPIPGILTRESLTTLTDGKQYTGEFTSAAMFGWLTANMEKPEESGDEPGDEPGEGPDFGKGCSPRGLPPEIGPVQEQQARAAVREAAIGKGSAFADALKPKPARVDWRAILRNAFETANTEAEDRTERSFARASRRQNPEIVMPGMVGTEARMAVIVDVSGSVGPEWAAKAAGYIAKLGDDYPGVSVFLATHTDELCWSGFVTPNMDTAAIQHAMQHTGGTDAEPAYAAAREVASKQGRFDVLIHFTDCELPAWPECPAKRQIVGVLVARGVPSGLPKGARPVLVTP